MLFKLETPWIESSWYAGERGSEKYRTLIHNFLGATGAPVGIGYILIFVPTTSYE